MTTIGFGDITPTTGYSRVITTVFIFIVIALFSIWVSEIMNLHSKLDENDNKKDSKSK